MKLSIQPRDIELADKVRDGLDTSRTCFSVGCFCPTAQALTRLGYTQAHVGTNYATVKRGDWRGRFSIPLLLTEQIESWDAGLGFKAGDFDLIPVKMPAREQARR